MDSYEQLSPKGYKAVSVYSAFLFFAGSFTQVITLIVLLRQDYRKKLLTPCFLSIIVSNFLLLYGSLPTTFVSSLMNGWIFNYKVCVFVGFVSGTGSISMITTMAVITVKIYLLAKNKPFIENRINPHSSHTKVLFGVWLYSICSMLPPATGITEMRIEGSGTNCVPNWSAQNTSGRIYVIFLLCVAYIIPVSVSAVYLVKVRREIIGHLNETNYYFLNLCFRNLKNINKMCIFAVVFFTIAWLPYATIVFVCMSGKKSFISPEMEMIPTLLAKTSAIFNPFIYSIVNPRFRNSVLRLLRIHFSFNCDENECVDVEVGNVKGINKGRRGDQEDTTKTKNKNPENKSKDEEIVTKNGDKRKERHFTENADKHSYPREFLTPEVFLKDERLGNNIDEYELKTWRSEESVKKTRLLIQYTENVTRKTSSKESYKNTTFSSSEVKKDNNPLLSDSCSNFVIEKTISRSSLRPKIGECSSSSTLNISMTYRAYKTTSSEKYLQNFTIPGSLS